MSFGFPMIPESEEIRLALSPIREVICQVRFPTVLRIRKEDPSDLQERLRDHFPGFETEQAVELQPGLLRRDAGPCLFRFLRRDQSANVTLAPDSYALTFSRYDSWSEFVHMLSFVGQHVREVYGIGYATRIGLRYINMIGPEHVGSESVSDLSSVVRDELVALLDTGVLLEPSLALSQVRAKEGDTQFTFRYGIVIPSASEGRRFVLDFDCFTETQHDLHDVIPLCMEYHRIIYGAFRWCIPDCKLVVFRPEEEA